MIIVAVILMGENRFPQDRYFNTDLKQGMEHLEMGVYERSAQNLNKFNAYIWTQRLLMSMNKIFYFGGKSAYFSVHVWSND